MSVIVKSCHQYVLIALSSAPHMVCFSDLKHLIYEMDYLNRISDSFDLNLDSTRNPASKWMHWATL